MSEEILKREERIEHWRRWSQELADERAVREQQFKTLVIALAAIARGHKYEGIEDDPKAIARMALDACEKTPPVSGQQFRMTGDRLMSYRCVCGSPKQRGDSFCSPCWRSLTVSMQVRLARMLRRPFVLHHIEAVAYLKWLREQAKAATA